LKKKYLNKFLQKFI